MQKASEWAQSHDTVSYDKRGSLGNVSAIAKHAVDNYVVMLVCSSCAGFKPLILGILVRAELVVPITFDHELP